MVEQEFPALLYPPPRQIFGPYLLGPLNFVFNAGSIEPNVARAVFDLKYPP
jgi:hypothetical protein